MASEYAALQTQNKFLKAELANLLALQAQIKAETQASTISSASSASSASASSASSAAASSSNAAIDPIRLQAAFQYYDADCSGYIDQQEFEFLCADLGVMLNETLAQEALKAIDTSQDGKISFPEFSAWFNSPDNAAKSANQDAVSFGLLRLKLHAKLLSRKAIELASQVNDKRQARNDTRVHNSLEIVLGKAPEDEPKMSIVSRVAFPSKNEFAQITESYDLQPCQAAILSEILVDDDTPAAELDSVINSFKQMLAQNPPPRDFVVNLTTATDGDSKLLRFSLCIPHSANLVPANAIPMLNQVTEAYRGINFVPLRVDFAVSLDDMINNPEMKASDFYNLRVTANSEWTRGALDMVGSLHPFACFVSLFAGAETKLKFGSVSDLVNELSSEFEQNQNAFASELSWNRQLRTLQQYLGAMRTPLSSTVHQAQAELNKLRMPEYASDMVNFLRKRVRTVRYARSVFEFGLDVKLEWHNVNYSALLRL